jgi:hypothetical protein
MVLQDIPEAGDALRMAFWSLKSGASISAFYRFRSIGPDGKPFYFWSVLYLPPAKQPGAF